MAKRKIFRLSKQSKLRSLRRSQGSSIWPTTSRTRVEGDEKLRGHDGGEAREADRGDPRRQHLHPGVPARRTTCPSSPQSKRDAVFVRHPCTSSASSSTSSERNAWQRGVHGTVAPFTAHLCSCGVWEPSMFLFPCALEPHSHSQLFTCARYHATVQERRWPNWQEWQEEKGQRGSRGLRAVHRREGSKEPQETAQAV